MVSKRVWSQSLKSYIVKCFVRLKHVKIECKNVDRLSNNWHATYNKRTKDFFQKVLWLGQAIAEDHKVSFMNSNQVIMFY
jgi:hypothetical protein